MLKALSNLTRLVQRPKPAVGRTPHDVVHRENKWRLLRFRGPAPRRYRTPILMVPSLINRWYVLDLMPGKSFIEWLVDQGHDVYCIDWGNPGREDRYLRFDDIVGRYLGRALRRTCEASGVEKAHVLGYCMGGTLAAIHAAAHPERVASLTGLAAPVAFDDDGILARWTKSKSFDVGALVDAFGNVPWPLLQASFQWLRPTLNLSKAVFLVDRAVLDRAWNDEFLDGFLAKERWANDNVSLPGEMYRRYIEDLYQQNRLVKGTFRLDGRPARLEAITCPVHVLSFQHDYIVPEESASPLAEKVSSKDVTHLRLPGGHVGAVVSGSARKRLWPLLSSWWAERDGGRPLEVAAE
ncbi:MAG TPA: alpha/beta fold hydrolase [Polyangiaceae bacterium LLY-WYZ-15_(1-7)]|nr:class III poly(R)-hydroxyalkanoic acid synthase subunit PhaC [Myxococcales bacterium]MAT26439.1 class III poly(R)-hydroxyalkanoic acid synthase subunit PhaC [Sandaracinus sp.]HJK93032.1 alpha/beta fold hydrolase [Polyangiaceae bacterium LLY-WYZ-15_(1-7)]MBJ70449.1 class III poly(R)-hydroxyalkanoic acid synthase subunit PhaC [Sandaracinus sp.]HJL01524.1 alpha/beta fold hydrolase [Polyangiaceae bacterium LLY-WYZ-15_(1-7)]